MKHHAVKIILEGVTTRVVVHSIGTSIWQAAWAVLRGWEEDALTFEVHYEDGRITRQTAYPRKIMGLASPEGTS